MRAVAVRLFDDALFFFGFAAAFFFTMRLALLFARFGDLRFTGMLYPSDCNRCGSVDGDLGQCGEGRSLPLDGRENEFARALGEIEGESGLMALG